MSNTNRFYVTVVLFLAVPKLQPIPFNHLSDINFKDFINLYKNCTAKLYYVLFIDTTLASYNRLSFKKNFL